MYRHQIFIAGFVQLTNLDDSVFVVVVHTTFVEHFPMDLHGVGVDDVQAVIVFRDILLKRNFVDFRFCIVIVVDGLEGR